VVLGVEAELGDTVARRDNVLDFVEKHL
jgi:hypothetical protein